MPPFLFKKTAAGGGEVQVEGDRPGGPRLSCLFLDGTAERDDSSAVAEPRSGLRRGCPTLCCARVGKDFPASPTLQTARGGPPIVSCGARGAPPAHPFLPLAAGTLEENGGEGREAQVE